MGQFSSKKKKGKKGKSKITDHDRAVLDLKNSRDRLKRYQKKLTVETDRLFSQAQQLVKEGRKDRALLLLKIKKYKNQECDKADAQLLTVETMIENIAFETQQMQVFDALKKGNSILDRLHEEMPVEQVEQLMADSAEAIAIEEEIGRALGGGWSEEAEQELGDEFAALEKEMAAELGEQMPEAPVAAPVTQVGQQVELPAVPTDAPVMPVVQAAAGAAGGAGEVEVDQEEAQPERILVGA